MTTPNSYYNDLMGRLRHAEERLGFDPCSVEQGSHEWHRMRLGVITASKAKAVVAKAGSQTRRNYMAELAAEIITGQPAEQISAKALEWGNQNEGPAVETYSFITGLHVDKMPFVYGPNMRTGCSPDGITERGGLEIKCPFTSANHILTIADGRIKDEYTWQIQFSLWVSGLPLWTFGSYDPRMRTSNLHTIDVEPSDTHQKALGDAVPQFIHELDQLITLVGGGPDDALQGDIEGLPF